MQAQEILRSLRLPEFDDLSQFFRQLPATALVGIGAFAAVVAYWFASRPRAVKPPCDLHKQSEEVEVRPGQPSLAFPKICMPGSHRMTCVMFGLQGNLKIVSFQPPAHGR